MDRNLRIRMLLEAADKVSRPLRDIAGGGTKAAQALKATRDELRSIERAQKDMASFGALKTGLASAEQQLGTTRDRVRQLTAAMRESGNPSRALIRDLDKAEQQAGKLERQIGKDSERLERVTGRLREAGIEAQDFARHERELGERAASATRQLAEQESRVARLADRERRMSAARERFGRMQQVAGGMAASGAAAVGTGVAIGRGVWEGVSAAQAYESAMTDIAQKADLGRVQAARLGKQLLVAARDANQLPDELQRGVDTLSGFGLAVPKAVAMMTPIGRAATAYKAEIADLSAAAFAANDNLKVSVEQTARVIDIMAQAGKAGAFEIKDMAGAFPALTAGYQALGQTGTGAVADLAAALQIARKGAGDSATAANNVANIIQKIASPLTIKAFRKFGIDLPAALKKAYAEGKTPLEAIAELTSKATGGDLGKIGFLFEDAQVQQGLRPLIQNLQEYRRIRAEAAGASGTTDTDFAERMKDSAEQTKALRINAQMLAVNLGSLLLPTVNAVTGRLAKFAGWIGGAAQRHPYLAKAAALTAAGLAVLFTVFGIGAIAIAGIMGPIAILNAGLVAMGVAGGVASVGLLPIIGTVALVVGAVAALAAVAYLVYTKWSAITGFFAGAWAGIKAQFSGGIGGIVAMLADFSPLGTIYRVFAPVLRWLGFDMPARFSDAGRDMIRGLIGGITGMFGALKSTIVTVASSAATWFKQKLGIHSPSRVFMGLGGHVMGGLDRGIAAGADAAIARVRRIAGSLTAAMVAGSGFTMPAQALEIRSADARQALARGMSARVEFRAAERAAIRPRAGPAPAPAPITINITQAPGQSAEALAREIERVLDARDRRARADARATYRDDPDGADL